MTTPAPPTPFAPLPPLAGAAGPRLAWPTPNRTLFSAPGKFFARTRVNPDYGKPGFTRDCGRRCHRGCDIAPVAVTPTGRTVRVIFTDCATGQDFASDEPAFVPHDEVFGVYEGRVAELVEDETVSDFGNHLVLEHRWPHNGEKFYTLYAHLARIVVAAHASIAAGQLLGRMGQTSRSAEARQWLAIAPHLHFEARNAAGQPFNPEEFLRAYLRRQSAAIHPKPVSQKRRPKQKRRPAASPPR